MKIILYCLAFFTKCCVHTMTSVFSFACHLVSGTKPFVGFSWNSVGLYVSSLQKFVDQAWVLCKSSQWRTLLNGINKFLPVLAEFIDRSEWNSARKMSEWGRCTNRPVSFMKICVVIGIFYFRAWMTFSPFLLVLAQFGSNSTFHTALPSRRAAHGYHDSRRPRLGCREN